jgi:hypothetical protein
VFILKKKNIIIIAVIAIENAQTNIVQADAASIESESVLSEPAATLEPTASQTSPPALTSMPTSSPASEQGEKGESTTNDSAESKASSGDSGSPATPTPAPAPTQSDKPAPTPAPVQTPNPSDGGLTQDERQQLDDTNDYIIHNQPPMPTPDPSNNLNNW